MHAPETCTDFVTVPAYVNYFVFTPTELYIYYLGNYRLIILYIYTFFVHIQYGDEVKPHKDKTAFYS